MCFANKVSVNTSKTKYILFLKLTNRNNIPLKLPDIKFNNFILNTVTELKFLGVMIDENLNWQSHIKLVESKTSKNIRVLFKGLKVYTCTSQIKLKKILTKQKHAICIIFHEEKEAHARPLLKETHALNFYQINILQILTFTQKVKNAIIPRDF